jgi:hypothetical protein
VKDTKADVFLILDCCHAASAVESLLEDQNNIAELLVASSIEGKAPLRDQHSLTHKLVQILGIPDFYLKAFETSFSTLGLSITRNRERSSWVTLKIVRGKRLSHSQSCPVEKGIAAYCFTEFLKPKTTSLQIRIQRQRP